MSDDDRLTSALTSAGPALLAYFRRRVAADDAADLVAETMVVAWRRRRSLPVSEEEARMWLFGVARNVLLNAQRSERRRWSMADRLRERLTAEPVMPDDEAVEVRDAIAQLPVDLAELVRLVHWDGWRVAEAAELLGIPASTARSRHARAKDLLRDALSPVHLSG
jgi:RNA polymerase sigma-70 factor (ECF subfamily)